MISLRTSTLAATALLLPVTLLGSPTAAGSPTDATIARAGAPALTASPPKPLQGNRVVLKAQLPTKIKRPTLLQRNAGDGWRTVARKKSKANGSVTYQQTAPGDVRYRVQAPVVRIGGVRRAAVTSKVRRVNATPRAQLISAGPNGRSTGNESGGASLSADGRYVAFISSATNLVSGFTGYDQGTTQIYLRDRVARTTLLVSAGSPTVVGNGSSSRADISDDGRFVTFASTASNLVGSDTNGHQDIFRWSRSNGSIIKITAAGAGGGTDDNSFDPTISGDGERIAYSTEATNIDADDDNGVSDIYVWDAVDGENDRISDDVLGGDGNGVSNGAYISTDGRFVVFMSSASDLVFNDTNGFRDVFRANLEAGSTSLVSRPPTGVADDYSGPASISDTGRYIAFASAADNLTGDGPGEGTEDNGTINAFVRDMIGGETVLISAGRGGGTGNAATFAPSSVSADGRLVTFTSLATNLVKGDRNTVADALLWDRTTDAIRLVVRDKLFGPVNGSVFEPVLSTDGRWISFYTVANDVSSKDRNATTDLFVWRR